ncbi:MAG: hypothetical protein ACE10D_05065 [Planctomycetota bacterium]|nr:hypothetical protein [Planctomycetota bacterium]
MARTRTEQDTRPVFRLLRPFWWVAHAVTGYKIIASWLAGAFVVGIACGGGGLQDINSVRNLASYLTLSGDPIPLAADGRIDVYIFVRMGEIEGEDDLQVYVSALTGQGPTLEEMLAGDYTNFPYERYRGEVSPNELGVPLLWDKQPCRGDSTGRIVGLTQGRCVFMEEAELQALLCRHGQADLPEGP